MVLNTYEEFTSCYDDLQMKSAERRLRLLELFARQEFVGADELCQKLAVSDSTVRRDLIELEQEGVLRRVHGGALSLQTRDDALDFRRQVEAAHDEKVRIGAAAAALVRDGQTVILGGGSTVVEVARNLFGRGIQVITNSVPIAQVFWDSKSVEVTLTGGYLYPRTGAQLGPICEQMLDSVAADVLILGVGGLSAHGLSDSNTLIVGTMRKMIDAARKVVIAADHTKFGRDAMVHIYPLDRAQAVVTDRGLSAEQRKMVEGRGIDLILA
jgi:DeoR/GlpR family transcriptional regulator of sugar metabolism